MEGLRKIIFLLLALAEGVFSAKILSLMVVASHSHHLWNSKYLEALVDRGHHVTYFGVDEYKHHPKNLSHILVKDIYETLYGDSDSILVSDLGSYRNIILLNQWDVAGAEFIAESEAIKHLIRLLKKEKFDLIVHDIAAGSFLLGAVDVLGRPPVIGITAFGVPTWTLDILGNPMAYSSKPFFYVSYSDTMTFLQRANNYFLHLFSFVVRWFYERKQDELSRKLFGSDVRPLDQIQDDINIIMVNSNPSTEYVFPRVPGLIPVGGLNIQKPKPLPRELKTFLDEAKHGVVYFSLGTNIISTLTKEKLEVLMKAFKEIAPVQVLCKMDPDAFPGKPENVRTEAWIPQNDVLAHENVRVFFTHSGLLSTQEAIYHGKPMVGMPFFLDQDSNLAKCVNKGFAERLHFNTLTPEKIVSAIRKVLGESRYAENVKKASAIFRDEMDNGLDRAIYWTEYAIRHKGAPHLRHSARNLYWYQNWMLDVVAASVTLVLFVLFFGYKLFIVLTSRIFRTKLKKN